MAYLAFQRFFYGNGMHGLTDGFVRRDDAVPLNGQLRALDLLAECVAKHAPCAQFLKDGALLQALLECLPPDTPRRSGSLLRAGERERWE